MGQLDGKVAFITGGARGQGRSHAVMMAEEGADIITLDLCDQIDSVVYRMATPEDLEETVRLVEKTGRRIVAQHADVRDFDAVNSVVTEGVAQLGRLDFVIANAGIMAHGGHEAFYDTVDVLLSGVYHTCEAAIPTLIDQHQGGAIVITSSSAGLTGRAPDREYAGPGILGYTAAKHGVVGLMRAYANSLAPENIRCNTVHPCGVASPMVVNEFFDKFMHENPNAAAILGNALPVSLIEPSDVSDAVLFLCSDRARYITGVTLPVDAGYCNK
jgi:SDR family mycofactocin-dependent oxidoreductase